LSDGEPDGDRVFSFSRLAPRALPGNNAIYFNRIPTMSLKLEELREDYRHGSLDEADTAAHPFDQFKTWFAQARQAELPEPNAMVLATQTPGGGVAARVVLLKELSHQGFVFYSNYTSRKGQELAAMV
jgi:pyridoxamine 5'-phosphate oxidase